MKLNPNLKSFWKTKAQIKVLQGGRMSSKTEDTAGILAYLASRYTIRVACLRRFQNKISESVYKTLKRKILEDDYLKPLFTINETSIKSVTGSEFVFMGIQRNLEEIKGLDDISITWIEEAEKLTEEQWNLIRPTILRREGSFCLLVFNPNLETDFVYKEFVIKKHDNVLVRKINYDENPFLSNSALSLIEADRKKLDEDEFNHIYKGYPKKDDNEAIIKRSWIEACIDAHIKLGIEPTGIKRIGFDIADDGVDTCVNIATYGIYTYYLNEWKAKEDELMKSSKKTYDLAFKEKALIQYDCIGVGASAGSHFKSFNENSATYNAVKYLKFDAGASVQEPEKFYQVQVKNKDYFLNLKAQSWWSIADRMRETYNAVVNGQTYNPENIISISGTLDKLDELIEQLAIPKKQYNNNLKNKVESKDDLKKRGIPSPNLADAFIMANFNVKNSNTVGLNANMF